MYVLKTGVKRHFHISTFSHFHIIQQCNIPNFLICLCVHARIAEWFANAVSGGPAGET